MKSVINNKELVETRWDFTFHVFCFTSLFVGLLGILEECGMHITFLFMALFALPAEGLAILTTFLIKGMDLRSKVFFIIGLFVFLALVRIAIRFV